MESAAARDYFDRDIERIHDAAEKIINVAVNPAAVEVIGLPENTGNRPGGPRDA